jgi:uncharacterized RDD family membrane protein YckC
MSPDADTMSTNTNTWPAGARLVSNGQVVRAYALALLLFIVTLGVGYLAWSIATWGEGQTPAQRILGLRCWHPATGRTASRGRMALRQLTGLAFNGQFLLGVIILLSDMNEVSVGDVLAGTVVLCDLGATRD